jgi:serine/threonine-protein kinase
MAADIPDDPPSLALPARPGPRTEREMREAEDLALAASGLGSGLLKRQPLPEDDSVAVLKVCPHCGTEYETAARFCPADGTSLRPKGSDSLIDRVLAERYHILKRIGEGGMGRVYLGEHVKMNRQCAIKVMSPALVNDQESATRFAREASSAARIIHPNVAAVFDFGESEGLVYLVMEYVDGEPLSRIIAREAPLSIDRAVDLTRQIADGLGAAHELGIIHRDLKPDNILVARTRAGKEVAKVVDFGIAKAMQEAAGDALTRTGLVIGTPEFMSPEQLLGDPIDARSDLYALGCILHLMLTAAPPFEAATREQMIKRRLAENSPHVQALDSSLPDSLDRIVERLLARNPGERYGSAAEVRDALNGNHKRLSGNHEAIRAATRPPTPRSAPTIAIGSFENATTEMNPSVPASAAPTRLTPTAVVEPVAASRPASPRRRPAMLAAGGAVAVGLIALALRFAPSSGSDVSDVRPGVDPVATTAVTDSARLASSARDSARKSSVRPPVPGVRPAGAAGAAGAGGTVLTSAASTAEARQQRADRLAKQRSDSATRVESKIPIEVRKTVIRYVNAIETLDIAKLKEVYPFMSGVQEDGWKTLFGSADSIRASPRFSGVTFLPTKDAPTTIEEPFSVQMRIFQKGGKGPTGSNPRNTAVFRLEGANWVLREIH